MIKRIAAFTTVTLLLGVGIAQADTTAPPPPNWMTRACRLNSHGIPRSGESDCFWTGTTSNGPETLYLVRTRVRGLSGLYRPHVEAVCTFHASPTLQLIADGCTIHKARWPSSP